MSTFVAHERSCERARSWASLDLDDELSQLERARLAAHLRRCRRCATAVQEMRAATSALRSAPLERPARHVFALAAATGGERGRRATGFRLALAATLAALAAALGAFAGSVGDEPASKPSPRQTDIALFPSADDLRDVQGVRPPAGERGPSGLLLRERVGGV